MGAAAGTTSLERYHGSPCETPAKLEEVARLLQQQVDSVLLLKAETEEQLEARRTNVANMEEGHRKQCCSDAEVVQKRVGDFIMRDHRETEEATQKRQRMLDEET